MIGPNASHRPRRRTLATVLFSICLFGGSLFAGDFYWVDPDGDNSTGVPNDPNRPYQTITYVMDNEVQAGDTIMLFAGECYADTKEYTFGKEDFPINWLINVSIVGEDPDNPSIILGKKSSSPDHSCDPPDPSYRCILRPYHPSNYWNPAPWDPYSTNIYGRWNGVSDAAKSQLKNLVFMYGGCQLCTRFRPKPGWHNIEWGVNLYIENVRFEKSSHSPLNTNATKNSDCRDVQVTYLCHDCEFVDIHMGCHFEHQGEYSNQFTEVPELRAYFENCTFGYQDGIPAFDGTDNLWGGQAGPDDPSGPYWGSHFNITAVADMDIIVKDCKFYGLDEDIAEDNDPYKTGEGRHHNRHAIAMDLTTFYEAGGTDRVDADMAISLGTTGGGKTVIEKGFVVDGSATPDACEYGASKHGIYIKTSKHAFCKTNPEFTVKWNHPGTKTYQGDGLDYLEITDVENSGDGGAPNDGIHLELKSHVNDTDIEIDNPCKIFCNESRGIFARAKSNAESNYPTITIRGASIYDNGMGGICLKSESRTLRAFVEDCDVYNSPSGNGIYGLKLWVDEDISLGALRKLIVTTNSNTIQGFQDAGMHIIGQYSGPPASGGGIDLEAQNDRIYNNGGCGIFVDYPAGCDPCAELHLCFYHESVCHNTSDGLLFEFTNPTSEQYVKGYNCLFFNNGEDVDKDFWPGTPSLFLYSFWCTGLGDGSGNPGGRRYDPLTCRGYPGANPNLTADLHLTASSLECIDRGNYSFSNGLLFDMEGDPRKIRVYIDETDMGADEYDP